MYTNEQVLIGNRKKHLGFLVWWIYVCSFKKYYYFLEQY